MDIRRAPYSLSLGTYQPRVEGALARIREQRMVQRIWERDHTIWRQEPREITDRLGWLSVVDAMWPQVRSLEAFALGVRDDGYKHAVLLGMGGSALGPDVLRRVLGHTEGFPELLVLDSTVPQAVKATLEAIDVSRTLFIVSSKSGTTLETLALYDFFRGQVEEVVGKAEAGERFVAITDPGTPLERLARERGFRRAFLNPPDIGGRYSVLSYFGLVPAALAGYNLERLLDQADTMRRATGPDAPIETNPAAWLGAIMAGLAMEGRDKLTLAASPSIEPLGGWIEQMLAESSGKEGKGIVPVTGEALMGPRAYGEDRVFIHLRCGDDDTAAAQRAMGALGQAGHPVAGMDVPDAYALGAEFFCWEMATAIACGLLGVHPFDQPNVQQAKDMADHLLREGAKGKGIEATRDGTSIKGLLEKASPGDYVAVLAYLPATPDTRAALNKLRRRVAEEYRIATCLGFGPGYLHSTGQLFKGGPPKGHFIFITSEADGDMAIPGREYTFGTLANTQALGDMGALRSLGRPVAHVHLGGLSGATVEGLAGLSGG